MKWRNTHIAEREVEAFDRLWSITKKHRKIKKVEELRERDNVKLNEIITAAKRARLALHMLSEEISKAKKEVQEKYGNTYDDIWREFKVFLGDAGLTYDRKRKTIVPA